MTENSKLDISILYRTGFPQVLLYLYAHQNSEVNQDDLIRDLGPHDNKKGIASATVRRAIEYCESHKIITIIKMDHFPFKHIIGLTEKGRRLAKVLASFAEALNQE